MRPVYDMADEIWEALATGRAFYVSANALGTMSYTLWCVRFRAAVTAVVPDARIEIERMRATVNGQHDTPIIRIKLTFGTIPRKAQAPQMLLN